MNTYFINNEDTVNKPSVLTPGTIMHFIFGLYFSWIIYPYIDKKNNFISGFILVNILHFIYELKDHLMSYNRAIRKWCKKIPFLTKYIEWSSNNSVYNSIGDQLFAAFGYILGYYIVNKYGINLNITILVTLIYMLSLYSAFLFLNTD
tara:strand:+ start:418 stop:861 length:444 start_codon:yes stop_codon:yes gene_type:complete